MQNSYNLFVSEFSFEKFKCEAEEKRLEYTLKLNKTLSDVQNQLITIPLSLLVLGSQIVFGSPTDLKNWILLISMLFFSIIMWIVTTNQKSSISAILTEIQLSKEKLDNTKEIREIMGVVYEALEKKAKNHNACICIIRTMVVAIFLLTFFMIFKYETLKNLISWVFNSLTFFDNV